MKNKKLLSLAVAGALGLLSSNGLYAFGLGKIEVNSALNQPFNAKIPVTAISTDEAEVLQVLLSSNEEFEKAGLQKTFALTDLRFDVVRRDPKNIYIKVTSDRAIKEPLLDFLITANAGGGRLIREYTVFLDPPEYVFVAPETKASKQLQSKPKPAPVYKPATTQAQTTKPTSAPVKAVSMTEYATKRNDTLWNIALLTRPDKSVSVNQMMMALLDANPTAFNRGNINSLKAGQVLTIPSLEQIRQLSKAQATRAVAEQNQAWKNRNKKVPKPADTMPAPAIATTDEQAALTETDTQAIDSPAPSPAEIDEEPRLKLVTPTDDSSTVDEATSPQGNQQVERLSEQLTFAQETIEAQRQENLDLKARIDMMQEQLETMNRMLSIYDPEFAKMQDKLEKEQQQQITTEDVTELAEEIVNDATESEQNLTAEDSSDTAIDETQTEAVSIDDESAASQIETDQLTESDQSDSANSGQQTDSQQVDEQSAQTADDASDVELITPEADQSQTAQQADEASMQPGTATNVANDTPPSQSILMQAQTFIEQNKMPVLLGILLFLILLWLLKRRNARSELTFEEQMAMQSTATETAEKPTDESETDDNQQEQPTENNDETVAAAAPTSKQKTVDEYIAQADMFVGYADYAQARTSLEKARDIDADNRSVNEKLLFVLYKQQQTDSFNSLITDANIDLNDPVWTEAAEWARELDPHNERYAEQQIDVSSIEQSLDDIEPELNEPLEPTEEAEVEESLQDEPLSTDLEFDLDKFAEELDAEADQFSSDDKTNDLETLDLSTEISDSDTDDESLDINDVVNLESEQSDELNLDSLDLSDLESELDSPDDDLSLELDIAEESQPDDTDLEELALSLNDEADSEQLDEDLAFDLSVDDADDSLQIDDELTLSDFDINDDSDELTNTDTADNDLDFELEDFDEVDEAETKLDLANAYIEMGDPEGARSILQEVLKDGSSEQKVRAQSALDSIRTA